MRRDQARLQLLALVLLVGLGLLCLDLEPIRAAVADYLHGMPETEAVVAEDLLAAPGATGRAPALAQTGADAEESPAAAVLPASQPPSSARVPHTAAWARIDRRHASAAFKPRLRDLADARRRLGLTEGQRAGVAQVAADARRDLDDLRYVRNDRGRSWHGIVADVELIPALDEANRLAEIVRRLARFVDTELSGRGETYRQSYRHLLDGWRARTSRLLTPEQHELLAVYDWDPVFDDTQYAAALGAHPERLARLGVPLPCEPRLAALRRRAAAG